MNIYWWIFIPTKTFPILWMGKEEFKAYYYLAPLSYSFIVALSVKRYYGILGSDGTINSKIFIHYLEKLVCNINDIKNQNNHKFIFIADNAAIHKSREVQRFLEHNSLSILSICPYSPWLNPVESYISAIKAKIKKNFNIRNMARIKF